ncbi:MAG: Bax inhibitor-1/YccA family protein [Alphaproteobacteria bacterium]|nr:Bax inhibitor-1/YccA family protein [Alphaproteobacteria bacterium]
MNEDIMTDPFFRSGSSSGGVAGLDRVTFDAGLRTHMQRVFGYMGGGLAITGLLAWVVANTVLAQIIFGSPLRWVVMLAPLAFIFVMNFRMNTISLSGLKTMFWLFCGTMGLSMGAIFLVFTGASIARAFFITAATFGAMALWGYTTKRNLASMGAFLMMGLFGLMIAMIVNIFMMSSMLQWMVSIAGVAIFTGLTAWDVQRIKQTYSESYGAEANDKLAVFNALSLYLNFINAFQFMLELTGQVRRS